MFGIYRNFICNINVEMGWAAKASSEEKGEFSYTWVMEKSHQLKKEHGTMHEVYFAKNRVR